MSDVWRKLSDEALEQHDEALKPHTQTVQTADEECVFAWWGVYGETDER